MESNFDIFLKIVDKVGFPATVLVLGAYLLYKTTPKILERWDRIKERELDLEREKEARMQEYQKERQRQYDEQMQISNEHLRLIAGIAEQTNVTLQQNNAVLERNNTVIEANTRSHEKVVENYLRMADEFRDVVTLLKEHDKRAERINFDLGQIKQIVGRCENKK